MKTTLKLVSYLLVALTGTTLTAASLEVKTITGNEAGFLVNSHLIVGKSEALLVDAQFTRSQAQRVVEAVKASSRELKTVYVTHAHPDHYFGLETISKAFPKARLIAKPQVVSEIKASAQGKLEYWKKMYGAELPDQLVLPEADSASSLQVDGTEVKVIDIGPGESESASVLYVPSLKALVSGDLIFNDVHLWLAEDRPEGWLNNLKNVRGIGPIEKILSGHGAVGGNALIRQNETYIGNFLKVTSQVKTKEEANQKMKALYPKHALPVILELSTAARVK